MATAKFPHIALLLITAAITIIFCFAIGFDISPFLRGPAPYPPEWQWAYAFTNTVSRIWAPGLVGLLGVGGFLYFDKEKNQGKRFFTFTFLLFNVAFLLLLQICVLYFSRAGIGVLLERVINPGITGYFTTALSIKNIGSFLITYSNRVPYFPMRAADHPPFAVLFFSLILWVSQGFSFLFPFVQKIIIHHTDMAYIWNSLLPYQKLAALLSTIVSTFLSALTIIPIYYFAKLYYNGKTAVRTSMLYSIFPAVSLFLPVNDVFLGLFGMLGFLFYLLGERKKQWVYFFLSGLALASGTYFSVSLLVVLLMLLFFLVLSKNTIKEKVLGGLEVLGGFGILPIALFVFYNFNSITVFTEITKLQAKRSYLPWVFYDIYDFFIFSGIPVLITSTWLLKTLFNKSKDHLALVFFSILFVLDISGFSRAETGRIWMPYMPFLAVIVANFLTSAKLSTKAFAFVIVFQLIQLLVMQEFWVTLW